MNIENHSKDTIRGESRVHLLPCNINYDGPADINSYFISKIKNIKISNGSHTLNSHIRGRQLKGKEIILPKGCAGLICSNRSDSSNEDNTDETWISESHFGSFISWQHDVEPDIPYFKDFISWFDISRSVSFIILLVYQYHYCNYFSSFINFDIDS
jgi:ribonuclease H2 subunit C